MKLCVAQTKSAKGDVELNIHKHINFINKASSCDADMIIFPELSLTGYEPSLAKGLAISENDKRLEELQSISNAKKIIIGAGIPTKHNQDVCISLIIFQPYKARKVYSKKYIHADEEPFFIGGRNFPVLKIDKLNVGLAICYELSIAKHADDAVKNGAEIYVASVAKSSIGVEKALIRLSEIARQYSIMVIMANGVGPAEDFLCAGRSSVISQKGVLIKQLDDTSEGILVIDTISEQIVNIEYL